MPLIRRLAVPGLAGRSPRSLLKAGLILAVLGFGLLVVLAETARLAVDSGSAYAGGALVLGLGLFVAVIYGMARDTTLGILVWLMTAAAIAVLPGVGPLSLDRLAFLAVLTAWFVEVVTGKRELGRLGITEFLMLVFVVLCVASIAAPHELPAIDLMGAERDLLSLIETSAFFPFAAFLLARQTMHEARAIVRFCWTLTLFGVYMGLTNLFWALGLDALVFPRVILDEGVGIHADRARGIFLNAAVTGYALLVCFIAAMYLASQRETRFRSGVIASGFVMMVGIALTQTRSAWLATGLVLILSTLILRGFRRWYIVILVAIGLVIGLNWSTFTSEDRAEGGVASVNETHDRLNATATGIWGIEQKPIFGWGLGRFVALNTVHHQAWSEDTPWKRGYGIFAHDTATGIGAELGLVGLGVWVAILASMVVASWRAWRALPRSGIASRRLVVAFWCVLIAWLTTALLIDIRLFTFANAVLFVFGGICAGLADRGPLAVREPEPAPAPGSGPEPARA